MTNIGVNLNENQFSNKSLTLSKKSLFCSIIGGFFIDKDYTHNVPSQESELILHADNYSCSFIYILCIICITFYYVVWL